MHRQGRTPRTNCPRVANKRTICDDQHQVCNRYHRSHQRYAKEERRSDEEDKTIIIIVEEPFGEKDANTAANENWDGLCK